MEAFDGRGTRYRLIPTSAGGGEGSIYRVEGSPSLAVKVFHPHRLTREIRDKLEIMVEAPPDDASFIKSGHHSITWPLALAFQDPRSNQMIGYVMRWVDPQLFKPAHTYYDTADRIRRFGGLFTWRHLLIAATNLASAVAAIHQQGHRVGDLRDSNVLVGPDSLICLIDCDSFQILDSATKRVFPTRVGTGEFLPRELQGEDLGARSVDRYHSDLFALAVLVFKFLMLGVHPHQARGGPASGLPTIESKIRHGVWAFGGRETQSRPPPYAPPVKVLSSTLRTLAEQTFVDGHSRPARRVTAEQWLVALSAEARKLKDCKRNPNHVFARHLRLCPWCAMSGSLGDPFPPAPNIGSQIAAARPKTVASLADRTAHLGSYVELALVDGGLSEQEQDHIYRLGATLGLHRSEVARIIKQKDKGRQKIAPTPEPATRQRQNGSTGRSLQELQSLVAEYSDEPEESGGLGWLGAAKGGLVASAAASITWLFPAATLLMVVLVVTPLLACLNQVQRFRRAGTSWVVIGMRMLTRVPQSEVQTIYHLIPVATYAALPVLATYFVLKQWGGLGDQTVVRSILAASAAGWVSWIAIAARKERFLRDVKEGFDLLDQRLATAIRWRWLMGAALGTVIAVCIWIGLGGAVAWWPLGYSN